MEARPNQVQFPLGTAAGKTLQPRYRPRGRPTPWPYEPDTALGSAAMAKPSPSLEMAVCLRSAGGRRKKRHCVTASGHTFAIRDVRRRRVSTAH